MRSNSRLSRIVPRLLALVGMLALTPSLAGALTLTFDGYSHGDVVTGGDGVTVSGYNQVRDHDVAVAFDSEASGTRDPDLEAAWSGGNIADQVLGRMLIIQESTSGCDAVSCGDNADDEGGRAAGTLTIEWDTPTDYVGFDLIDLDDAMAERGWVTLFDTEGGSVVVDFEDAAALSTGVVWGDNTANRIDPLVAELLGLDGPIVKAEFRMGGSGAIDNIEDSRIVPEPGTALMMGLGLLGLARAGRQLH